MNAWIILLIPSSLFEARTKQPNLCSLNERWFNNCLGMRIKGNKIEKKKLNKEKKSFGIKWQKNYHNNWQPKYPEAPVMKIVMLMLILWMATLLSIATLW